MENSLGTTPTPMLEARSDARRGAAPAKTGSIADRARAAAPRPAPARDRRRRRPSRRPGGAAAVPQRSSPGYRRWTASRRGAPSRLRDPRASTRVSGALISRRYVARLRAGVASMAWRRRAVTLISTVINFNRTKGRGAALVRHVRQARPAAHKGKDPPAARPPSSRRRTRTCGSRHGDLEAQPHGRLLQGGRAGGARDPRSRASSASKCGDGARRAGYMRHQEDGENACQMSVSPDDGAYWHFTTISRATGRLTPMPQSIGASSSLHRKHSRAAG